VPETETVVVLMPVPNARHDVVASGGGEPASPVAASGSDEPVSDALESAGAPESIGPPESTGQAPQSRAHVAHVSCRPQTPSPHEP
jgi:hypothetical protein